MSLTFFVHLLSNAYICTWQSCSSLYHSKGPNRLKGSTRSTGVPISASRGTHPKSLESTLTAGLSPNIVRHMVLPPPSAWVITPATLFTRRSPALIGGEVVTLDIVLQRRWLSEENDIANLWGYRQELLQNWRNLLYYHTVSWANVWLHRAGVDHGYSECLAQGQS